MISRIRLCTRDALLVQCSKKDFEISEFKETLNSRRKGFGWFKRAPRIRMRQPENKCQDQVLELAVLNERLAGASPWEVRRQVEYLKKRQENWDLVYKLIVQREAAATLDLIEEANSKVEEALSEETKESKSVIDLKKDLIQLEEEVNNAHKKLHSTELRVRRNLQRIQHLKAVAEILDPNIKDRTLTSNHGVERSLKDYWYPIAFSKNLTSEEALFGFELFDRPWVLFRDEFGKIGCILDECAHRACPLSIGKVCNGRVTCPYHGWEYNSNGECLRMPSTVFCKNISISSLPATEKDGLIWVWPGSNQIMNQENEFPNSGLIPDGYTVVSEIEVTAHLSHELVLDCLLDTYIPQMLTSWLNSDHLPNFYNSDNRALDDESIIDLSFEPPCNVLSLSGILDPKMESVSSPLSLKNKKGKRSFHKLHVCLPSSKDQVRILQRTSINFLKWMHHIPPLINMFECMAQQALKEDLELMKAQQERIMKYGFHNNDQ